jgi:large subunit ribosomal protein L6
VLFGEELYMSRIGKMPIPVPKEVTATVAMPSVHLKGPKGEINYTVPHGIEVAMNEGMIQVSNHRNDKASKSLFGFVRAHLANQITGITKGFTKTLELSGVGYRANLQGTNLVLSVGFSHPVTITPPAGITFAIQDGKIVVSGTDKQKVGQIAADVRAVKPPEPYKGKGIKYVGEVIRKKAGKSAKAVGGK